MKHFQVVESCFPLKDLPEVLAGKSLLLLSDLHEQVFGPHNAALGDAVRDASADVIVCTGDMLDRHTKDASPFLALLDSLHTDVPIFFAMGNHELDVQRHDPLVFETFVRELQARGVHILRNECAELALDTGSVLLFGLETAGRTDGPSAEAVGALLGPCPKDLPVIVLCHDPSWFPAIAQWGAGGVLSGHIHGGLIALPGMGGLLAPGGHLFPKYVAGLYREGGASLYVTRGFGDSFLHFRLGVIREAALLKLCPPDSDAPADLSCTARRRSKESRKKKTLFDQLFYKFAAVVLVILLIWCLLPLGAGVVHIGVVFPVVVCLGGLIAIALRHRIRIWKQGRARIPILAVQWLAGILAAVFVVVSAVMLYAARIPPHENATAVVLGAQVVDENPGVSLTRRLDRAVTYLNENPQAACVVSGKGQQGTVSQAQVMARYLIQHGISPDRIYLEAESDNTKENLEQSAQLIQQYGLSTDVAIVTEDYHQLRAGIHARKNGLQPGAASCASAWWLLPGYWVREMFALANTLLLGG